MGICLSRFSNSNVPLAAAQSINAAKSIEVRARHDVTAQTVDFVDAFRSGNNAERPSMYSSTSLNFIDSQEIERLAEIKDEEQLIKQIINLTQNKLSPECCDQLFKLIENLLLPERVGAINCSRILELLKALTDPTHKAYVIHCGGVTSLLLKEKVTPAEIESLIDVIATFRKDIFQSFVEKLMEAKASVFLTYLLSYKNRLPRELREWLETKRAAYKLWSAEQSVDGIEADTPKDPAIFKMLDGVATELTLCWEIDFQTKRAAGRSALAPVPTLSKR